MIETIVLSEKAKQLVGIVALPGCLAEFHFAHEVKLDPSLHFVKYINGAKPSEVIFRNSNLQPIA